MIDKRNLSKTKKIKVADLFNVERAKIDKIYPSGTIAIQASASDGELYFFENETQIEPKYAVFIPKSKINTHYMYYAIARVLPEFLAMYRTGINIQLDIFDYMIITIHEDEKVQRFIVDAFVKNQKEIEYEQMLIEKYSDMKRYYLGNMFPKPR